MSLLNESDIKPDVDDNLSDDAREETIKNISIKRDPIGASVDANDDPEPASPPTPMTPISKAAMGKEISMSRTREFLSQRKWPEGLQETFIQNLKRIPIRYFICDDSGSMNTRDGHVKVDEPGQEEVMKPCTRWEELSAALKFHAELAHAAAAPTEFRFLNTTPSYRIGFGEANEDEVFAALLDRLTQSPNRKTPLCKHIGEVIGEIRPLEEQLRSAGQKACIMIASDGESSDGDIVTAMRPLRKLPVWVVIRLCTDNERIVNYWNDIDSQLELDMDVLDDLSGEAAEVHAANPWLTYGEPLHRLREFGVLIKEADMMDTTKLTVDQIRRFCVIIFGGSVDDYPHPQLDWEGFIAKLQADINRTGLVWDPHSKKLSPWMHAAMIKRYKPKGDGCCVVS